MTFFTFSCDESALRFADTLDSLVPRDGFRDVFDEDVMGLDVALCEIERARSGGVLASEGPEGGLARMSVLGDSTSKGPEETVRSRGGVEGNRVAEAADIPLLWRRREEVVGALFAVTSGKTDSSISSQARRMTMSRVAHVMNLP